MQLYMYTWVRWYLIWYHHGGQGGRGGLCSVSTSTTVCLVRGVVYLYDV